jgi:hypothetical protein
MLDMDAPSLPPELQLEIAHLFEMFSAYVAARSILEKRMVRAQILASNIRNRSLRPILRVIGETPCGFHSFRRFRVTFLRKRRAPEDLIRFWIGHADKSVTDGYSRVREDVAFRTLCAENAGLGFELPAQNHVQKPEVAPKCTLSELLSTVT